MPQGAPVGQAVWALAPFAPEAPFRLYPGPGERPPVIVDAVETLRSALSRGGDPEVTVLTPAKVRPVLVVANATDTAYDAGALVLRLLRFDTLGEDERAQVRKGVDRRLVYLHPSNFPGLSQENAAIISTLTRVASTALETSPLGELDSNELRIVHERIAAYFRLDLGMLVKRMITRR